MKLLDTLVFAFKGTRQARRMQEQTLALRPGIRSGLGAIERSAPGDADAASDDAAPIFLLSAGWRSGSTLLQRLLMSDRGVLLWGEPFDECGIVQAMAGTLRAFRPDWPPADYFLSHHEQDKRAGLSGEWIANLFPETTALHRAHRAFFEEAFAVPARQGGWPRWGIKEVRLTAEHAFYLRWLYPKAKFLLLYRSPFDAYRSYARFGRNWYDTWPDQPVFTPAAFGRHWKMLLDGYFEHQAALGALLVRYEDLARRDGALLDRIESYVGLELDRSILGKKVGSSARGSSDPKVSAVETALLRRAVEPLASRLGYFH